ncbi:putative membrane protein [Caenispirillum salinarum AK4]|uniref:Putative membrane protein n=1 Tax=Caenispirillum salinarum AK4 TaxID=1238182 RepID=K9HTY0_9PROT|nr:VTT domain-containing protein [Caenispirillum salinarum]EKV31681.1 putative membrane protein [Caenispirillum salinarum AK4]
MKRRFLVLFLILLAAACAWFVLHFHGDIGNWLREAQGVIAGWVDARPLAAAAGFIVIATLGKVTPFPGGIAIMLTAGTLFGPILGPLMSALGAALSALLVGALGRVLIADAIDRRFGHRISHLEEVVAEDGFNWLLAARLLPVLPAWLVNLVPVVFPIPLWKVFVATLLGLLPISFVLGSIGDGLATLAEAETVPADILLSADVLLPLVGLAVVALAPVAVKRLRQSRR